MLNPGIFKFDSSFPVGVLASSVIVVESAKLISAKKSHMNWLCLLCHAFTPSFLIEADSLSSWYYYSRISEGDRVDLKGSTLHFPILISEKKITFMDALNKSKRIDTECSAGTTELNHIVLWRY